MAQGSAAPHTLLQGILTEVVTYMEALLCSQHMLLRCSLTALVGPINSVQTSLSPTVEETEAGVNIQ